MLDDCHIGHQVLDHLSLDLWASSQHKVCLLIHGGVMGEAVPC
jgi:hypothetical protein